MNSMIPTMTATKPSFGMPACDVASAHAYLGTGPAMRLRDLGGFAGGRSVVTVAAAQGAFPGTTAWRPPTC